MGYEEITASSLVKLDFEGNIIDPGSVRGVVNFVSFITTLFCGMT